MPFISETLPNPKGSDQGAEWVELGNNGAEAVSLAAAIACSKGRTSVFP